MFLVFTLIPHHDFDEVQSNQNAGGKYAEQVYSTVPFLGKGNLFGQDCCKDGGGKCYGYPKQSGTIVCVKGRVHYFSQFVDLRTAASEQVNQQMLIEQVVGIKQNGEQQKGKQQLEVG